jgi:perosamine synthetase
MQTQLAILGGRPIRTTPMPPNRTWNELEKQAVMQVMDGDYLSLFEGNWQPEPPFSFRGGPYVQKLEKEWAQYYGARHAVAVNSATSGLYAAVGASGAGPGDEVIVSPYSMTASATAPLIYNAIPIFADVEAETFNLDPADVARKITPRTKAIIAVHQFGHPADMDPIMELARRHKLVVIEDAAQAHGALYKGRKVGTLGHIGVFSLNVNKTIQTGEGGVITTNDDDLAERMMLIRNHGEAVVERAGRKDIVNAIGWNYRLGEIEAAIASVQLAKLEKLNRQRLELTEFLTAGLARFPGITPPRVMPSCIHTYYLYTCRYDAATVGVSRRTFVQALTAEGTPFYEGYMRPLYLQPLYQQRIAYGRAGCPFSCAYYQGTVDYGKGACPTAERLYEKEVFLTEMARYPLTLADMEQIVAAMEKVFDNLGALKAVDAQISAQAGSAYVAADRIPAL